MPFSKGKIGNVGFRSQIYVNITKILFGFVVFSDFSKQKRHLLNWKQAGPIHRPGSSIYQLKKVNI